MKARFIDEEEDTEFIEDSPFDEEFDEIDDEDIEIEMKTGDDELETSIQSQLRKPEYARVPVSFTVKGEKDIIDAIPMAKMKGDAYLMKIDNVFKKFKMKEIEKA